MVAVPMAVVLPGLTGILLYESSTTYHSTHGDTDHPYIPIYEYPPAVPDLFSANCAVIVPSEL